MTPLELMIKGLEALKSEKAWYDFDFHFWAGIDSGNLNIKTLKTCRQALSFLNHQFEKRILNHCKHEDVNRGETFEMCNTCEAIRHIEQSEEGYFGWGSKGQWKEWKF